MEQFVQMEYLMSFLMGLHDKYGHNRSQILLMDPPPLVNKAFALISQEEEQRSDLFPKHSPVTLNVTHVVARPLNNQNFNNRNRIPNRAICTHCGIHGHTRLKDVTSFMAFLQVTDKGTIRVLIQHPLMADNSFKIPHPPMVDNIFKIPKERTSILLHLETTRDQPMIHIHNAKIFSTYSNHV